MRPQSEAPDVPPGENVTAVDEDKKGFTRLYGAHPWHLLSLLASFAVTGYVVLKMLEDTGAPIRIAIWFIGAAVVWDLVLGPLLTLVDRGARPVLRSVRLHGVPALNFVRFPALLSLLLLLIWTPLIFQRSEQIYQAKADLRQDPYLERWLVVSAALFALSFVVYSVVVLRAKRASESASERAPE